MEGVKYQIEATDDGFRMTLLFAEPTSQSKIRGVSFESAGGHDELEELYGQAERTWDEIRREHGQQVLERLGEKL